MHARRRRLVTAALFLLAAGTPCAWAQQATRAPIPQLCQVPDELLLDSSPLLYTSKQLRSQKRIKIVALGSSSTLGMGATGPEAAYPARLEAVLTQQYPGVTVQVVNKGVSRQSAKQMLERINDVLAEKPALVIWETGTAEAVRGSELDEFVHSLLVGVEKMTDAGIDVILMDTQYSRSTARIINFQPYVDAINQVGGMRDLVVFPRYQIMRLWVDEERFTFADKNPTEARKLADQIYDCLARLLARSVGKALK
jgi:acyl-CoA thioesterase I